ncbi:MAG: hypothetical protein DRJ98_02590 [Thermoprotei archaeon]|nr:MAG: hypothetical protein DRJ98_02590 [Thermoprotei archaeon]
MNMIENPKPWWLRRPTLRKILGLPLLLANKEYRRWRNAQLSPGKIRKRLKELDKKLPRKREDLVGRDREYQLIMSSVGYHVIRDKAAVELFQGAPPPKFIILKGATGTGKTMLAEVCLRDAVLYGLEKGVNVQPMMVSCSEIFHPLYGQSVRNIAAVFKKARFTPTVLFFDEFHAVGMRVEKAYYAVDREDVRVQDAFIDHLNRVLTGQDRVIVLAATSKLEGMREDIRRRAYVIDLDQNITRDLLLAVLRAELEKYGWTYLDEEEVMKILERSVSAFRQTQLTPFDIIDACNRVRARKVEPLRQALFKRVSGGGRVDVSYKVSLDDFKLVARELRGYVEQEKSSEVMSSVLRIKPAVSYSDIGGLFGIKEKLFKIISLSLNPDLASKLNWVPPKGFLLWGEPGCGKTYLSKAIAKENDAAFFYVPAAQLLINAKWVGDPEKNVKDLFELARRSAPSIIFFDEFDVIASRRRGDPVSDRMTAQILTELDGLQPLENVIVIAATNRLDTIDEAVVNRFEPYVIEVPLPRNDAERLDVIRVHLRQYVAHLDEEVDEGRVLSVLKKFRLVSPRVVAEVIREANRLRSQEVMAASELRRAMEANDPVLEERIRNLYREDLERLERQVGRLTLERLREVTPSLHRIKIFHFEAAAEQLKLDVDKEIMDAQESMLCEEPTIGTVMGLATDAQGRRGVILIVECSVNPRGTGKVTVTGAARTVLLGHTTPVEDVSVQESAINVTEYVRSYVHERLGIDISSFDFKFQVISPLEGVAGLGVSGPSLGLAFSIAAISELSSLPVEPGVAITGKGDIKGNVGPVGGLGWRGAGKIVAAIQTRKVKVKKFILPRWNYERGQDEVKVLEEVGIHVIPVERQVDAWLHALNIGEEELLERLRAKLSH